MSTADFKACVGLSLFQSRTVTLTAALRIYVSCYDLRRACFHVFIEWLYFLPRS